MSDVNIKHLYKVYPNGTKAVNDFDMQIADKEFIVFVGPSGCGKSTTLRMIAGLEDISAGELSIGGLVVNDVEPKDRDIAMVFQNYALYPHMTVYENIAFGLRLRKLPKEEIHKKVTEAAEILGITEYLDKKPKEMSGGQRQRVALGRAIVREPKVMLLDEPLSNLDAKLRTQMRAEILKLHKKLNTTFIYVTHDQVEAMTMGTRIVVMKEGYVQQTDAPKNLYDYPVNKFVAGFIGTPQMNFFKVKLTRSGEEVEILFTGCGAKTKVPYACLRKADPDVFGGIEMWLGIRAEDLSVTENGDGAAVKVKVSHTEELGSETLIYGNLDMSGEGPEGGIIRDDGSHSVKAGDVITAAVNVRKLHLFYTDTERTALPRIPLFGRLHCKIQNRALHIGQNVLPLPPALDCSDGECLVTVPTDAFTRDGELECEIISCEDAGGVKLAEIDAGGERLYAALPQYNGEKTLRLGIDLKRISVSTGEGTILPLPAVNRTDCKFVKRIQKAASEKGKKTVKSAVFGFQSGDAFFEVSNEISQKIFTALGIKKAFTAKLRLEYTPYGVAVARDGIAATVQKTLDYGAEKFLACEAGGNTVYVKTEENYSGNIYLMPDFGNISVVATEREIKII